MPLWARPGYLIRRLHQIQYALFLEECAGYDITPVQYGLLTALSGSPDVDQNTLGRELGIDRTNVADVLKRLERRGLVTRVRGVEDRRTMLARLTAAGETMVRDMYARLGFTQREAQTEESTQWKLILADFLPIQVPITTESPMEISAL